MDNMNPNPNGNNDGFSQVPPQGDPNQGYNQVPPQADPNQAPPQADPNQGYQQAPQPNQNQSYDQVPPQGDPNQGYNQVPPQSDPNQGYNQAPPQNYNTYGNPNQGYQQPATGSNSRTYSFLSYIGILWLIGLFSSEKNNPTLRFHIGQGIVLSIAVFIFYIVCSIINGILLSAVGGLWALYLNSGVRLLYGLISWLPTIAYIVFAILGMVNVSKNNEKPLPLIGRFAFFK